MISDKKRKIIDWSIWGRNLGLICQFLATEREIREDQGGWKTTTFFLQLASSVVSHVTFLPLKRQKSHLSIFMHLNPPPHHLLLLHRQDLRPDQRCRPGRSPEAGPQCQSGLWWVDFCWKHVVVVLSCCFLVFCSSGLHHQEVRWLGASNKRQLCLSWVCIRSSLVTS